MQDHLKLSIRGVFVLVNAFGISSWVAVTGLSCYDPMTHKVAEVEPFKLLKGVLDFFVVSQTLHDAWFPSPPSAILKEKTHI